MEPRIAMAAAMVAVLFAGCSDKDPGPTPAEECDGIFAAGVCTPHTEPSVVIEGLAESVPAYLRHEFTWRLDNGTRGMAPDPQVHSMDSRILAVDDGAVPGNETLPDSFGTELATQKHKDLPQNFTAEFSWDAVGATVDLWGYMLIDGENVWNLIMQVTTTEPEETGTTKSVTFDAGPPPEATNTSLNMALGDAVQFVNNNPALGYTVSFDCGTGGPAIAAIEVAAGDTSQRIVVKQPVTCDWDAVSDLSEFMVTNADFEGRFTVNAP